MKIETPQQSIRHAADERVLVLCWGNPGRLDDGLGPCLADRLRALAIPGVTVDSTYQLQVEHADLVAQADLVVFVDASMTGPSPFLAQPLAPLGRPAFSTHALEPGTVLALAKELYDAHPRALLLGVRGIRNLALEVAVADLAPNGTGLMLAPSHRMMSDIPMENIEALMEAMEELA